MERLIRRDDWTEMTRGQQEEYVGEIVRKVNEIAVQMEETDDRVRSLAREYESRWGDRRDI